MNINKYKQRAGLLALLMISCLCLLLAGCGKTSQKQVDLIFSHEPDRWLQGAQSMKEQLESDGAAVNLIIFSTDEEQKAAIDQAVAEKPDCIVLAGGDIKNLRAGLDKAKQEYRFAVNGSSLASQCLHCGQCEGACPQSLPIISYLEEAARTLE